MNTDPVADMLTRIRNANKALHDSVEMPSSRLKREIARILKEEGYVRDFQVKKTDLPYEVLVIELKYGRKRERVLTGLKRISRRAMSAPSSGSSKVHAVEQQEILDTAFG